MDPPFLALVSKIGHATYGMMSVDLAHGELYKAQGLVDI